jgi:oligoribonuclease NrnB/cAMP/cGMP phosphodiesterase (DHH superfamily)
LKKLCFYHAGCPDGFGAAWAVRRAWGEDAWYVARSHDDRVQIDECEDALVAFVDIAPARDELRALADVAAQVLVIDHHVTARDRLASNPSEVNDLEAEGHVLHFDLTHSGAMLAWLVFHPDTPPPDLLRYVQDQDLWSWALDDSDAVNAAIASYPRSFETWDQLAERPIVELVREGQPILRANRIEVERRLDHARPVVLENARIEAVNASINRAQIGHELSRRAAFGKPWGLVYRVEGAEVFATLYSIGELDVSEIAKRHGGGGHANAAGFHVSLERWLADFVL